MIWQGVLDAIDAIESWIVAQSYWLQIVIILAVLGPLAWFAAGLIDRAVEAVLAWHSRRDTERGTQRGAAAAAVDTEQRAAVSSGRDDVQPAGPLVGASLERTDSGPPEDDR